MGQRLNIILVAEGAIDKQGNSITSAQIRAVSTSGQPSDTWFICGW